MRRSDGPGGRVEQGVGDRRPLEKRCGWSRAQGQRGACCRCHYCSHRQGAGEQATGQGLGQLLGESQRALQGSGRRPEERKKSFFGPANPTSPWVARVPFSSSYWFPHCLIFSAQGLTASSAAPLGFL